MEGHIDQVSSYSQGDVPGSELPAVEPSQGSEGVIYFSMGSLAVATATGLSFSRVADIRMAAQLGQIPG